MKIRRMAVKFLNLRKFYLKKSGCSSALITTCIILLFVFFRLTVYLILKLETTSEETRQFKRAHIEMFVYPGSSGISNKIISEKVRVDCRRRSCLFTSNLNEINNAHAVLVSNPGSSNVSELIKLRNSSYEDQLWVFFSQLPPNFQGPEKDKNLEYFKQLNGIFNVLVTYRHDSDVIVHPFLTSTVPENKKIADEMKTSLKNRKRNVAWIPDDCSAKTDPFVKSLRKQLDVVIIGRCGIDYVWCRGQRLGNLNEECSSWLRSNFLFVLQVDRMKCTDYMSPEVKNILELDMIPILISAYRYQQRLPEGSYIISSSVANPAILIDDVIYVRSKSANELYEDHFKWKSQMLLHDYDPLCDVCENILYISKKRRFFVDLYDWWIRGSLCYADWPTTSSVQFNKFLFVHV